MSKLPFNPKSLDAKDLILYQEMVEKRQKQGAPFDGPYKALMNHPELCQKIEALGYFLKFQGHLPRDVYQFIVLAVAKATKADFEWQDHISHALSAGVPQQVINSLKNNSFKNVHFPAPYQLAAELLSYTLEWKNISEPLQNACIAAYGMEGFIEMVTLSGFYQMFSAINQGFDIQSP